MNPVERSSLVDQTEIALLSGLRSGQWKGTLPGVRLLCSTLQISPPTLQAATARLLERGILISHGPRRRMEIAAGSLRGTRRAEPATSRPRRVVCLTHDTLPEMSHTRLEIVSRLRMEGLHWDFRHHVIPLTEAKEPRRQWDSLADTEQPDALIVFGGRPPFARWSEARGIPTVFIGGDPGEVKLPVIGTSPIKLISDSVAELARQGHRHICMPTFNLFPALEGKVRETLQEAFGKEGLAFDPAWNHPAASQFDPDVVTNTLTRISRIRMPTALIVMSWVELVAIESFLRERRLTIPGDVSVILLAPSDSVRWFRPRLTHFKFSIGRLTRTVRHWIDKGFPDPIPTPVGIPARIVRGESVARPPA